MKAHSRAPSRLVILLPGTGRPEAATIDDSRQWREALGTAVRIVESLPQVPATPLDADAAGDLEALRHCAEQIAPLLASDPADQHELRNLAGALRGYAEMLIETLDDRHAALRAALAGILRDSTSDTGRARLKQESGAAIHIDSEPGFILAVDDRTENRELLARYLSRSGHFVVTASSGAEALATLAASDVDVVLLDRRMPELDGREVLTRIKSDERLRATPVIMISGEQDMEGIVECIEAGADDYLFKPFNPVLLQARIKAGIERKRWYDREQQYRRQLERNERFIRATFGRYLSDDIVSEILERPEGMDLGGKLRDVTIMMSDIRGFTTLSEQLPADRVVTLLNRHLGAMTDIILRYEGTIDEFLGDAILAVFGAPREQPDHPQRAAHCALAMQAAMRDINAANQSDDLPQLRMGIALNTGRVIAGNIGSERRSKYGFVGHAMNVTSRIEDICPGGEILIASSTRDALGEHFQLGECHEFSAPGIDERLQVYPLRGALP